MCTIICKKFPKIGWVGVKNRDRSAPTKTDLLRNNLDDLEKVTLVDEQTKWGEGMNSHGISIISSSLTPTTNKSSLKKAHSKNGECIRDALDALTIDDVVSTLHDNKVTGNVLVFDETDCYLIEGENATHKQVIKTITNDWIVRTNHGIWIPTAGYQSENENPELTLRYVSSVARYNIAKYIAQSAKSPADIITMLAKKWSDEPQLNNLRITDGILDTRTTEQLMLIPSKMEMVVRNVDGVLTFTQEDVNPPESTVLVGII